MRITVIMALIIVLTITLAVGCGSQEASPTPTSTPAPTPTFTPTSTPSATPAATPSPTPLAVSEAWAARYNGPEGLADWAFALAVDALGNVYVTGKSSSAGSYDYSYATVKYDSAGNQLWVARYDGPAGDDDVAQAIVLDSSGNVYVTGKSYNGRHHPESTSTTTLLTNEYAYATVKYNSSGNQLWATRYDGPGQVDDIANAIAIDSSGNVYVTGSSGGDYATIKYDSGGNQLWVARYGNTTGGTDGAVALGVDDSGNIYVTGTSKNEIKTIKYDTGGNQLWVARY